MIAQPRVCVRLTSRLSFLRCSRFSRSAEPKYTRHPMLDDAVLLENLVEHFERPATVDHEIFGNDLKPVHDRFLFQDVR